MKHCSWFSLVFLAGVAPCSAAFGRSAAGGPPVFEQHIRPILKANCFQCHGEGEKLNGRLDVRLKRLLLKGGKSGSALVSGKPAESLLVQRVTRGEMPPGKRKLTGDEVSLIARWVAAGAPTARPEPDSADPFSDEERQFWSFRPILRPAVPHLPASSTESGRASHAIDAFLLAQLAPHRLGFAPPADKVTLIRRATFDLLGLPPSPDEVDRFVADEAPDAYERLLDRLLASPHYGERWGRHWLDVAGYADSEGYTNDDPIRKESFRYRDYVIRCFNADKPFDEFIREQLAGDELIDPAVAAGGYKNLAPDAVDKLVATGFLRMAPDGTGAGGVDQKLARNQVVSDTLKIVGTSLWGLTVGCAECHNHRYDPIPQTDYYRLRAVFEPALDGKAWRTPSARLVSLYRDADRQQAAEIEREAAQVDADRLAKQQAFIDQTFDKELAKLPEELREPIRAARATPANKRTAEQKQLLKDHPSVNVSAGSLYLYDQKAADELKKLADRAAQIRATKPVEHFIRALTEVPGQVPTTFLFSRGDPDQPRQAVPPGDLSILAAAGPGELPAKDPSRPTTGRRLALANRLTSGAHPLLARVLVNRVWMHHFGRGIVATPGDFGLLGERPTHPDLLDWLAIEFMQPAESDRSAAWRLKRLHKQIMTSRAYRQSSQRDPAKQAIDPENRLLGRMPVRRIEAEALRDATLAASGMLNPKMFGEPVPVKQDDVGQVVVGVDTNDSAGRPTGKVVALHGEEFRRSVYVQVRRSQPLAILETFDAPRMEPNCDARSASTVAPQSLLLMNNEFVITHARHFAARVRGEAGTDPRAQVTRAWRLAFARSPSDYETARAVELIAQQAEQFRRQAAAEVAPGAPKPAPKGEHQPPQNIDPDLEALASLCQALLSANEFLYVD
jgi:hypothetical protein